MKKLHALKLIAKHPVISLQMLVIAIKLRRNPTIRLIDELHLLGIKRAYPNRRFATLKAKVRKAIDFINQLPIDEHEIRSNYLWRL